MYCKPLMERTPFNSMTQLPSVTCHMGSHSVTFHPTQVNIPRLHPQHVYTARRMFYQPCSQDRSSKTKTKTKTGSVKTKTAKNRSRAVSRPRPRSRGLQDCVLYFYNLKLSSWNQLITAMALAPPGEKVFTSILYSVLLPMLRSAIKP